LLAAWIRRLELYTYKSNLSSAEVEERMDLYFLSLTRFNVVVFTEAWGHLTTIFFEDRV
jgi:hypothetical protein